MALISLRFYCLLTAFHVLNQTAIHCNGH